MSYGLNIYKSDGSLSFSTLDIVWMQIDQFTVAANASVSNSYPVTTGMTVIAQQQMVNDPPSSQEAYAPNVTVSGTTVSVAPFSGKTSEQTIIMVLAQD
jgi:hypothetical protein